MNKKKCLLFGFLILILIISLASVNASENTSYSDDSITSIDDNIQSIEDPGNVINENQVTQKYPNISNEKDTTDIISSSTLSSNHYVSGTSFSNIRSAANSSKPGDTITLNGTYHSDKKQITINTDNITIKGKSPNSKAILDGSDSETRILRINGDNVHLENLIFQNVHADIWGGTISSYGKHLTITNCEFINNNAQIGTIVLNNESHDTTIKNCIFKENGAIFTHNGTGGYGGAIDTHALNTKIINCTFTSNNALGGGAIYMLHHGNNTIKDCTFTNNTAKNGGAILQAKDNTNLNIINCNFTNNTAENNGGALYLNNKTAIKNSRFLDNLALSYGGGAFVNSLNEMINCKFENNIALSNGGGIYYKNGLNSQIISSTFSNNLAKLGGAIFTNHTLNISRSNFTLNNAILGGAIFNNAILKLNKSLFKFNTALNGSSIYNNNTAILSTNIFQDNQAKSYKLNVINYSTKNKENIIDLLVFLEYGDNYPGVYSLGDLIVDDLAPTLSKGAPNQELILTLNGKNFTSITNSSGFAIFEIPAKNLKNGNYSFQITHPTSNISTPINITGILEIFNKETNNNENNNKNSNINNEDTSRNSTNIIEMENNHKKVHSKLLSSGDTSDIVIYSDNPYIKIDTSTSSKNKNDIDKMFFGLFKDYTDDFYKKFPYAKNRTDANMLFISYLYKEFSHDLLTNPNSFLSIYPIALGLDLYVVGAFAEAYVACNGSISGFLKYPFFHDPQYNKFMDATFGEYSPWIKGILDFAIGIDANGDMSIAQFIINVISLLGVGLLEKGGSKILTRLNKLNMYLKGSKITIFIPNRLPNLNTMLNLVDISIQLVNKPHTGIISLTYDIGKFLAEKFGFNMASKGTESSIITSIIKTSQIIDRYLNNLSKPVLNILTADFLTFSSKVKNLTKTLTKYNASNKRKTVLYKGNTSIYKKNKEGQIKFIKKISKKISKITPKQIKNKIKRGIKKLAKQLGISNKNKKEYGKKQKIIIKTAKKVIEKVSTKVKTKTNKKRTKYPKNNKKGKNNKMHKVTQTAKKFTAKVGNIIKSKGKQLMNKVVNNTKKLLKSFIN